MPITPQNILAHEWTGLTVSVKDSTDPNIRGISGLVRNETRNTIVIESRGLILRVAKYRATFAATLPTGETLTVDGNQIRYRPEDRVKKALARW